MFPLGGQSYRTLLVILYSFWLLFHNDPWVLGRGDVIKMFHLGLSTPTLLFYAPWPAVQFCVKASTARRWRLRDAMVYACNNKSLWVALLLYPFSSIILVGAPLGSQTFLAIGSYPTSDARDARAGFHLVEQDLALTQKVASYFLMFVPSLL